MDKVDEKCCKVEKLSKEAEGVKNIQERFKCRITVLRKTFNDDLYQQYPYGAASPCGRLEEGQVFVTDNRWDPPEEFCHWAWGDLRPMIQSIHGGHPATMISCCTDGLRPVIFKLERVDTFQGGSKNSPAIYFLIHDFRSRFSGKIPEVFFFIYKSGLIGNLTRSGYNLSTPGSLLEFALACL